MTVAGAGIEARSLDVVVVNFRTAELTIRCVRSIMAFGIAAPERITIVDNMSGDGSIQTMRSALPGIRVVDAGSNAGFGAGVNLGFRHGDGAFVLVLNPDTYFERDSVTDLLTLMTSNPSIGIVGLDLINPDGSRQYSARRFYSCLDIAARRSQFLGRLLHRRIDRHLMKDDWRKAVPFDAEWVMGTGFVIRRGVFDAIGGMDTAYFLYLEDVDLCARVWAAGYNVCCLPKAELVHDHQRSSAAGPFSRAGKAHLRSLMRFASKYGLPIFTPPGVAGVTRRHQV